MYSAPSKKTSKNTQGENNMNNLKNAKIEAPSVEVSPKQKITTKSIALIALMTAVTCVLAPLSLPIGPVPISLTNLAIYLALYILGMKKGTISYIVYLFIGLVGVPVFSGFTGGPAKLIGPTGGYLIGFVFMAMIAGIFIDKFKGKMVPSMVGMILGTLVCYGFGTAWLAYQGQMNFKAALLAGVIPFIPGDLIKMVLAAVFGPQIIKRLRRSELN
jgi:biotin transport system substrate-specific component